MKWCKNKRFFIWSSKWIFRSYKKNFSEIFSRSSGHLWKLRPKGLLNEKVLGMKKFFEDPSTLEKFMQNKNLGWHMIDRLQIKKEKKFFSWGKNADVRRQRWRCSVTKTWPSVFIFIKKNPRRHLELTLLNERISVTKPWMDLKSYYDDAKIDSLHVIIGFRWRRQELFDE